MVIKSLNISNTKFSASELAEFSAHAHRYCRKLTQHYPGITFCVPPGPKGHAGQPLFFRPRREVMTKLLNYVDNKILSPHTLCWACHQGIWLAYGRGYTYKLLPQADEQVLILRYGGVRKKVEINTLTEPRQRFFSLRRARMLCADNYSNIHNNLEWEFNELTLGCRGYYCNELRYALRHHEETQRYAVYRINGKKAQPLSSPGTTVLYPEALKLCSQDFARERGRAAELAR